VFRFNILCFLPVSIEFFLLLFYLLFVVLGSAGRVVPGRASGIKISQDGVAVHPDCWCICQCYLHFDPENPEDGKQRYDIWVSPHGRPYMPIQTGGGETQLECSTTLYYSARVCK